MALRREGDPRAVGSGGSIAGQQRTPERNLDWRHSDAPHHAGADNDQPGSWRLPFQVIGVVGLGWVILWFAMVRASDLVEAPDPEANGEGAPRTAPETATAPGLWSLIFSRRMLVVFLVIACINTSWQILRAWLPKFLQEGGDGERRARCTIIRLGLPRPTSGVSGRAPWPSGSRAGVGK